jgi:BlaI family transcriptional regulator, penicillinase repressor
MKNPPRISDAEWQVMKVLWGESPLTANSVADLLADSTTWSPRTVKTLINRLVAKGALGFTKDGRTYHYRPLLDEADCIRAERRSFVRRVYDGAVTPMLANFIQEEDLTSDDIAELKRILNRKGRK